MIGERSVRRVVEHGFEQQAGEPTVDRAAREAGATQHPLAVERRAVDHVIELLGGGSTIVTSAPTFREVDYGQGTVCRTVLIKTEAADFRDVSIVEVGRDLDHYERRFSATHDYAKRNRYLSGFPNMFHADHGQRFVCGTILIKEGFGEWQDVIKLGYRIT